MAEPMQPTRGVNSLFVIAALVIVAAGLRAAAPVVIPLSVALFMAMLASPPISWLVRRKLPLWLAIVLVTSLLLGVLLLLSVLVGSSLGGFTTAAPQYQARLQSMTAAGGTWLATHGINLESFDIASVLNPGAVMGLVSTLFAELGSALGNVFLIVFMVIFILFDLSSLPQKLRAMTSDPEGAYAFILTVRKQVDDYFGVMTLMSFATGAFATLLLLLIGVDFALLWGLLAFLLNFIPNIGSIIAAVPPVLLALVQLGPTAALLAMGGYLAINTVIGSIITPRMMGRGLGLSTLTVFVSLIVWGWLLGPVGMLVSVPLTGAIKLGLETSESTRPIAILLGTAEAAAEAADS